MPHQIKVTDELYNRLKARANGQPIPQLIRGLLDGEDLKEIKLVDTNVDEGERLLEQLDNPKVDPLLASLEPGELPTCCQSIYDDPERPVPTCEHWEKAWVNHYGNKIVHYRNKLTGGSYFDYFDKYVGA